MKYLVIGEKFIANGKEAMKWHRIGELFESKAGKTYCKIYHMGPGQLIHVFDDTAKKGSPVDAFGADTEVPNF